MTGQYLFVKPFLLSSFIFSNLGASVSCIVQTFEDADKNNTKEMGVLNDGKRQGPSLQPPNEFKVIKQAFCIQ